MYLLALCMNTRPPDLYPAYVLFLFVLFFWLSSFVLMDLTELINKIKKRETHGGA